MTDVISLDKNIIDFIIKNNVLFVKKKTRIAEFQNYCAVINKMKDFYKVKLDEFAVDSMVVLPLREKQIY